MKHYYPKKPDAPVWGGFHLMRERGQWRRPLAYLEQMKDWRKWVSW